MNKRCENIKAVIFDMDGVIINSEKLWRKSFKLTNKKLKVYVPEKFRQSCSGIPFATNLQRMKTAYPDIDAELYFNTAREIHNYLLETDKHLIKNGFFKLISAIKEKNLKIGLCTSSTLPKVQSLFKKKNIPIEYFDAIITGDQVKNGKPHPEPYLATCDLLKENPKDCRSVTNFSLSSNESFCFSLETNKK